MTAATTIRSMPTSDLPYPMSDGLGMFTVFAVAERAFELASNLTAYNKRLDLEGTEFVVSIRKDGKFIVTAVEAEDELCWHVPNTLLPAA